MNNFKRNALEIKVDQQNGRTIIQWKGKSDDRDPGIDLDPYLTTLASECKETAVDVEFMDLEFMNSSTVQPILLFMKELSRLGITAVLKYRKDLSWQEASFRALRTVSTRMPGVTVLGVDGK